MKIRIIILIIFMSCVYISSAEKQTTTPVAVINLKIPRNAFMMICKNIDGKRTLRMDSSAIKARDGYYATKRILKIFKPDIDKPSNSVYCDVKLYSKFDSNPKYSENGKMKITSGYSNTFNIGRFYIGDITKKVYNTDDVDNQNNKIININSFEIKLENDFDKQLLIYSFPIIQSFGKTTIIEIFIAKDKKTLLPFFKDKQDIQSLMK